ncbi:juvenile hormone esterase [Halyomorpha halys]|uniref:juvenile hormone esterase n=1 Tax=Halyomorpha halys TaxID=286706 RepID=UPI0006D4F87E|nr:venom carboxylesterase-6-like [Halyomorpha halys]
MLTVWLCALTVGHLVLGQSPQVTVSQGTMRGQVLKSRDGRDYFSFTRIPYGKPPVGERRFKISEKADNWTGILDATQHSPYCYQGSVFGTGALGEEDCLYLNVFTPNISGKYPIIFYIHGGAFQAGSADLFGLGKYFMDEDVVAVYTNYRLGTLGFLSLEDNDIPGNWGLKDQALALEWVHREISAFGGDPNLITVIGESAGGASSDFTCSAPRTNGLIKACVSQSGTGWAPWAIVKPGEARRMALNLVRAVNCSETGDVLKCLQNKPVELVSNSALMTENRTLFMVAPVLEPKNAPGAILTSWPTTANRNYPWIIGVCQDEGLVYTGAYENNLVSKEETEKFIKNFNQTIIYELYLQNKTKEFEKIYKRFFTKGYEPLVAIRNFVTEYMFLGASLKSLNTHPGPTYFFKFNYTGGPQIPFGYTNISGVGHGADLPYFFEAPFAPGPVWPKPEDVAMSKLLIKMWVNFARNQIPSSSGMVQWPQFQGQNFLDIKNSGVSIGNYTQYKEIVDFWNSIFPDKPSHSSVVQSSMLFIAILTILAIFKGLFV